MGKANGLKKVPWPEVTVRVGAATLGGYAFTYAAASCLTLLLPLPKTESMLTAAMLSFPLYTGAILWAFAAATPVRAWIGLLAPAAICVAIILSLSWPLGG